MSSPAETTAIKVVDEILSNALAPTNLSAKGGEKTVNTEQTKTSEETAKTSQSAAEPTCTPTNCPISNFARIARPYAPVIVALVGIAAYHVYC